jgi:hypothetical protein
VTGIALFRIFPKTQQAMLQSGKGGYSIMHIIKKIYCYLVFLLLLFFLISICAYAGTKQELPRSYGAIVLGMNVGAFKKITDQEPRRCVHCADEELETDLFLDKDKARLFKQSVFDSRGATLKYQPSNLQPEWITCFFYKGRLYSIVMNGVKDKLKTIKIRYVTAIGKPSGVDTWDSGVSELRWKNSSTQLQVAYTGKPDEANVVEITYGDLRIMKQLPREVK